jgi:hypothetical protein
VARGDVSDLVTQHCLEFCFRVQIVEDAACDVHVPAARCERVDLIGVEHRKVVLQLRPMADLRGALSDVVHVRLQLRVLVGTTELLQDQGMHFL